MQKIAEQDLSGSKEEAEAKAKYTWEKDEIAYKIDIIYDEVIKVRFTGERWLSGNKWGYNKIYQFECLESTGYYNVKENGINKICHDNEERFFTDKKEAIKKMMSILKNQKIRLLEENAAKMTRLKLALPDEVS